MPVTSSVQPWTLTMQQGSAQEWNVTLTVPGIPGGTTPYNISGATWEYVVSDQAYTKLFSVTTTVNTQGILTVTSTAVLSQVTIALYSAATATLAPGTYFHVLWLDPGTSGAIAVAGDRLIIEGAPQP
jgi:hypothetical protein